MCLQAAEISNSAEHNVAVSSFFSVTVSVCVCVCVLVCACVALVCVDGLPNPNTVLDQSRPKLNSLSVKPDPMRPHATKFDQNQPKPTKLDQLEHATKLEQNPIRLDQTKLDQTGPNSTKLDQTRPNLTKFNRTISGIFRLNSVWRWTAQSDKLGPLRSTKVDQTQSQLTSKSTPDQCSRFDSIGGFWDATGGFSNARLARWQSVIGGTGQFAIDRLRVFDWRVTR